MPRRWSITSKLLSKLALFAVTGIASAQGPERVLVVINDHSSVSKAIGEYYARRRAIPIKNICRVKAPQDEYISREDYEDTVEGPVKSCLVKRGLVESIYYIVTTLGVPLRVDGKMDINGDIASVDSELTLLYSDIVTKKKHALPGSIPNPFYRQSKEEFSHPKFPIYLVTRLAGYDFDNVKAIIDKALIAENKGKFVIDLKAPADRQGDEWLKDAMLKLPKERVVYDDTAKVIYDQTDVIGYAGWGSNDSDRHRRFLGFKWLPGAIMTEYVSTNARTFTKPPPDWNISTWRDNAKYFFFSPQTMTADYIMEGATGASGHVAEPYLHLTPHPDFVLPAYYSGRNLAESYYLGIPALSWANIVVGDPLCSIGKPK